MTRQYLIKYHRKDDVNRFYEIIVIAYDAADALVQFNLRNGIYNEAWNIEPYIESPTWPSERLEKLD